MQSSSRMLVFLIRNILLFVWRLHFFAYCDGVNRVEIFRCLYWHACTFVCWEKADVAKWEAIDSVKLSTKLTSLVYSRSCFVVWIGGYNSLIICDNIISSLKSLNIHKARIICSRLQDCQYFCSVQWRTEQSTWEITLSCFCGVVSAYPSRQTMNTREDNGWLLARMQYV